MSCKDVQRCVPALIDNELEPQQLLEVESHLEVCAECQKVVEFERWFKGELNRTVGQISAPTALAARISSSLDRAERMQKLRSVAPRLGLAAAIATGVAAALVLPEWLTPEQPQAIVVTTRRQVIDYAAERHAHSLPVEVTGPNANKVARWFRGKVDFAVHPPSFPADQIQLLGGRISHVGDRQAAHLIYEHEGRPITVLVFEDTRDIPVGGEQRRAGNLTVHFGQSRGFNVAVWHHGGVSYAASSDLDQDNMIRLVASLP